MNIIESTNIDLVEPFPIAHAARVYGWMLCYKTFIETDISPRSADAYAEWMSNLAPNVRTFGVIDKQHKVDPKIEVPLIGMLAFEPTSPYNGYMHVASRRKAWGTGLMDEAGKVVIAQLFNDDPQLLRLSAMVLAKNATAIGLLVRTGFTQDGFLQDFVSQNNIPQSVVHFGLTRKDWNTWAQQSEK